MNSTSLKSFVKEAWRERIVPALRDYIRIPAQSPAFDPEWERHGHLERAVTLARDWVVARNLHGASIDILRIPGRTPVLLVEIEGQRPGNILLYGHLDKQPPFEGWKEGLGPWSPVERDGRLYGRGSADDGYAVFAATTAIEALQSQGIPHPRCVLVIEASEESGSPDLAAHVDAARARIGKPDLVICLDSGCGSYDTLWLTTSLRGMLAVELDVGVLTEGVHSGDASGVVPSSFRVLRQLLDRIENSADGRVLIPELHAPIPREREAEARAAAELLGPRAFARFPWLPGVQPQHGNLTELILNRTWRPTVSVTGADGLPAIATSGNVLRPRTAIKMSVRLPPSVDSAVALAALQAALSRDAPSGADIRLEASGTSGWQAPSMAPWLGDALVAASTAHFGSPHCAMGEGGSIPFMALLGERFPQAQFVVTGVLGPESNAHGPNEFLHLATGEAVTACVGELIARFPA